MKGPELQHFFSPSSIMEIFNNSSIITAEKKIILIKGIFKKNGNSNYGGFYYNLLKDELNDYSINLKTPELLHNQLQDNKTIIFAGFISRRIEVKGRIEIRIEIVDLVTQRSNQYSDEELKRFELLNDKVIHGFKDMTGLIKSRLLKNEPVYIKVITGKSGIIDKDIEEAIGNSCPLYKLNYHKISLNSIAEIINALNYQDDKDVDIICVARGGGDSVDIFENRDICIHLLNHKKIIAAAIGHVENKTLFEKMADGKFGTPSLFGVGLKDIYTETFEEMRINKDLRSENTSIQLKTFYEKQLNVIEEEKNVLLMQQKEKDLFIKDTERQTLVYQQQLIKINKLKTRNLWITVITAIIAFLTGVLVH